MGARTKLPGVVATPLQNRGAGQLALCFPYNAEFVRIAKPIGCLWSPNHKCRYLPDKPESLNKVFAAFNDKARVDARALYVERKAKDQTKYSSASVQRIIIRACYKVGITQKVKAHTFRHYFATNRLEQGTDIRYIQKIPGHNSPNKIKQDQR